MKKQYFPQKSLSKVMLLSLTLVICFVLLSTSKSFAVTLGLQESVSGSSIVVVQPGETFYLNITVDTSGLDVNGYSVYLTFDDTLLEVLDSNPEQEGIQPFQQGGFLGGAIIDNDTHGDIPAPGDENGIPGFQLDYTEVRLEGSANGEGIAATVGFRVLPIEPPASTTINFDFDVPSVRNTEVSHPDGTTTIPETVPASVTSSPYVLLLGSPEGEGAITIPPETTFEVNLVLNTNGAEMNGFSAYLTFDDTYLEVLDSDPVEEGIQPFRLGPFIQDYLVEVIENDTHGDTLEPGDENGIDGFQLDYTVGILDGSISGEGIAATVTLRSLPIEGDDTITTNIVIDFDPENQRDTRFSIPDGSTARPIVERPFAFTVEIGGICLSGHVLLQGRTNHSALITFEIRPPGETTPLESHQIITDPDGSFTFYTSVPSGVYDVTAKEWHCLRNIARGVNISPPGVEEIIFDNERADLQPDEREELRAGDFDNNNRVNLADFSGLAHFYGQRVGPPEEIPPPLPPQHAWHADFNGDGVINLRDFSLLASNYGFPGI